MNTRDCAIALNGHVCAQCGKTIEGPGVLWDCHLSDGMISIFFHPKCAKEVAVGLAYDGVEASH